MQINASGWGLGAAGVAVGLLIGYLAAGNDSAPPNVAQRDLGASLYVQTGAEYDALCRQTYRYAFECLQQRLAKPPEGKKPFAVVMDLDETVFDNTGYQSWEYRNRTRYVDSAWAVWEEKYPNDVALVPGAKEFITKVEALDPPVHVIYLSNRRSREGTLAALTNLGLNGKGDVEKRLIVRTDPGPEGGDKESRRLQVAESYRILLLVGDQLADLHKDFYVPKADRDQQDFKAQADAVNARKKKVELHKDRFGFDLILLPNPLYGDWDSVLGKGDPARHLRETPFTASGPRPK